VPAQVLIYKKDKLKKDNRTLSKFWDCHTQNQQATDPKMKAPLTMIMLVANAAQVAATLAPAYLSGKIAIDTLCTCRRRGSTEYRYCPVTVTACGLKGNLPTNEKAKFLAEEGAKNELCLFHQILGEHDLGRCADKHRRLGDEGNLRHTTAVHSMGFGSLAGISSCAIALFIYRQADRNRGLIWQRGDSYHTVEMTPISVPV
jgi:hypothetical protein